MADIEFIRAEIERMRLHVLRHRNWIMQLQRDGLPTTSAEALLDRMLNKIHDLCDKRNRLRREHQRPPWDGAGDGREKGYQARSNDRCKLGTRHGTKTARWRDRGCPGGLS
jgi:hypothetical protein